MGSLSKERRNRRVSWAVGVSLALATGSVLADAPKAVSTNPPSGLLTFANVKVVNVPPVDNVATKQSTSEGMRAYVDPTTKRLRPQNMEDAAQIAAESKAKLQAKSLNRARGRTSLASDEISTDAEAETFVTADGIVGANLTEDSFVYQVAHKQDGGLVLQEATGKVAAEKAARAGLQKKVEVSNGR